MKKYLNLLFLSISITVHAQIEVTYVQNYQFDSTDIKSKKSFVMKLFVFDEKSIFISENRMYNDSVALNFNVNSIDITKPINFNTRPDANKEIIVIENSSSVLKQYFRFGNKENYLFNDTLMPHWIIINKDTILNDIKCKKATTIFKGRSYTAWFSLIHSIPLGPYKFRGLPGLIIKIEDAKKMICYELQSIKTSNRNFADILLIKNEPKIVTDTLEKANLVKRSFLLPLNKMLLDMGGINAEDRERIEREQDLKEKKYNNPIELNNE
ncbi:MAG: GLPGLI family protein [Ferruginibacter sp.]